MTDDVSAGTIDLERYTDWFVWAREAFGRDLDATHAAAEAAYRSAASTGSNDEARAAAQEATGEPSLDAETMALAEWAAWSRGAPALSPAASVVAAKHALEAVRTSHNIDSAMSDVLAAAAQKPVTARAGGANTNRNANRNALIVAVVVVGIAIVGGLTAGAINLANQSGKGGEDRRVVPAAIDVTQTSPGFALVNATGLPPNRAVYIFVDANAQFAQTDAGGSLQATISIPLGGHNVSVCLDEQQVTCPASTFISRVQ